VVQVLGRHDVDGVDGGVRQQFAVIGVDLWGVAPDSLHAILGASNVALIGVADGGDPDIVGRGGVQPIEAGVTARADADPADVNLLIGAAGGDNGWPRGNRGSFQEIAPIEIFGHETSDEYDNSLAGWVDAAGA